MQDLIRGEVALAKQEVKEEATQAGAGAGLLAGAGVLALVGLIFVGLTLTYALTLVLPSWAAALLVAALFFIVGFILYRLGRQRLERVDPVPRQTIAIVEGGHRMDQTASQLRQELDQKRHDLTRDVERIEEKVKSSFDLNRKIDENPLAAVGLSVAGGFLLGNMVGGGKKRHASGAGSASYASGGAPSGAVQSGASTPGPPWSGAQWSQPSQPSSQGNGPGIVGAVKAGLNESFSRSSGHSTR